jgi:hypothetical protein
MKKFTIAGLIFILPLLIFGYLADIFLTNALKKSKADEFGVWNDIYNGRINEDLLIYGGSRAWVHFDPEILSDSLNLSVYNIGLNGHNFWLQKLRHEILLKYNKAPEVIIYAVDLMTLGKRPDLYNSDQFLPYMTSDTLLAKAISSYDGYGKYDSKVPLIRYLGKWKTSISAVKIALAPDRQKPDRIKGYQGKNLEWNSDFDNAVEEMGGRFSMELDSLSVVLFDEFLAECQRKNIKIIFVAPPEYIDGQLFVENRPEIMGVFASFGQKYDIPYYDYSNDSMSFNKYYFYNSTHMNIRGAELFSKKLVMDMKKDKVLEGLAKN